MHGARCVCSTAGRGGVQRRFRWGGCDQVGEEWIARCQSAVCRATTPPLCAPPRQNENFYTRHSRREWGQTPTRAWVCVRVSVPVRRAQPTSLQLPSLENFTLVTFPLTHHGQAGPRRRRHPVPCLVWGRGSSCATRRQHHGVGATQGRESAIIVCHEQRCQRNGCPARSALQFLAHKNGGGGCW